MVWEGACFPEKHVALMNDLIYFVTDYVKGELLVLVPVLYILAAFLSRFAFSEKKATAVLLAAAIGLSALYIFATTQTADVHGILSAIFTSLVQGILLAGTVIFKDSLAKIIHSRKHSSKKPPAQE